MSQYLTVKEFKLLSTIPAQFVDTVEAREPGFVDAQLVYWSDWIDTQLRKRYDAPFKLPYPSVVCGWLARIVTMRVWSKRGVDPSDKQWDESKADDLDARKEIAAAADGKDGLYDLPLKPGLAASGIQFGYPLSYSEASPYVGTTVQAERGHNEDYNDHGTTSAGGRTR